MITDHIYFFTVFFLIFLLVGISIVSIHYRKEYENMKDFIKLICERE